MIPPGSDIFFSHSSLSYSYVDVNGLRYGAGTNSRGEKYCYAYVKDRRPVYIDRIIHIRHERPSKVMREVTCAVVRPFLQPEAIPEFPLDPWYVLYHLFVLFFHVIFHCRVGDFGARTWLSEELGDPVIIDATQFTGHLVLCSLPCGDNHWWITVPHDHVSFLLFIHPIYFQNYILLVWPGTHTGG